MELKDSGTRDTFETGAVRDAQQGKGAYHLLPYWPIFKVACVYEAGARKYAPRNWEKGIPLSRFADSAMRHFAKWMNGDRDEDHLHQAIWNLMGLSQTIRWIEEGKLPESLNDLPNNVIERMKVTESELEQMRKVLQEQKPLTFGRV